MGERGIATELKDEFDFSSLDPDRWEQLCFELIYERNCLVKTVDGHGGDEGIDAYVGPFDTPSVIYQFKYFRKAFGTDQVRQIKKSLEAAFSKRQGFRWVLMCSADPTPVAMRALEKLREEHLDVEIEYVFGSEVKAQLIEAPKVRKRYYPDIQDQLEATYLTEGSNPLELIHKNMRLLNNIVIDDRFKATVTTDGRNLMTVYELCPGVDEEVPLFRIESKTKKGYEALRALYRDGTPFTLSPDDVSFKPLVLLPDVPDDCDSIAAYSLPDQRPASILLYPGDAEEWQTPIFVTLKTVKCGVEVGVRSNEEQQGCPIVIELEYPACFDSREMSTKFHINIRPRYEGCTVKIARKGARFLAKLAETSRLGLCNPNDDPEDASYCIITDLDVCDTWNNQAAFFDALYRICQFFGANPVIDDSFKTEGFFDALVYFNRKLDMQGKELKGVLSFKAAGENVERLKEIDERGELAFVFDETVWIDLFGKRYETKVRTVSKVILTKTEVDGELACGIEGTHRVYLDVVGSSSQIARV